MSAVIWVTLTVCWSSSLSFFSRFQMNKLPFTHRVLMERRGVKSPLLMVCSLLSYSDSRLRFCRSWKVLTLRQLILLAFSSLEHKD